MVAQGPRDICATCRVRYVTANQLLPAVGIGKPHLTRLHENPAGFILNKLLHLVQLNGHALSLRAIDRYDLDSVVEKGVLAIANGRIRLFLEPLQCEIYHLPRYFEALVV